MSSCPEPPKQFFLKANAFQQTKFSSLNCEIIKNTIANLTISSEQQFFLANLLPRYLCVQDDYFVSDLFFIIYSLRVSCRPNNDQIWLEVAKRYQQIIEKDIKLRYPIQPAVSHTTFQTGYGTPKTVGNNRLGNNHPLPTSAFPVAYEKEESLNIAATRKERKDTGTFPKILEVFSLHPSLPAQYFQENVTVKITRNGIVAEPVGGESLENNVPKQSEILCSRSSENLQEKRHLIDHDEKLMQASQGFAKESSLHNLSFQMNQRADILDYIDIKANDNEAKIGSLTEGEYLNKMHSGCKSVKKEDIRDTDDMVSANQQNISEQIYSEVNAKSKRKRRKRRTIFGLRRSKKRCLMDDLYCAKGNDQHGLDDVLISDGKNNKSFQFECCTSLKDANMEKNNISMDEKSKDNEKQSQEKIQGSGNVSKHGDEKTAAIPNTSQTELECAGTTDSDNDSGHSTSVTISPLRGNDIRQNKILDLKAKLAQQEQELQNLKRRKDFEDVEKEDCDPHDGPDEADLEMDASGFFKYETIFDFSHQTDVMFWAQDKENEDDFNLGKIDDLIDIFQKEIKSFRTLDTELYPAGRVTDYDHIQTRKYIVSENYNRLFAGIDNRMRLVPEDFASKEEFLFQLGLLRIYQ